MPIEAEAEQIDFLDVGFSTMSTADVLDRLREWSQQSEFRYVVTPNVDHVVRLGQGAKAVRGADFVASYTGAALRICDSRILARLAAFHGLSIPVVPGSDLTAELFRQVLQPSDRVALVGGKPDTIGRLAAAHPGPQYVQTIPPMGVLTNDLALDTAADFLVEARPNYTLFILGAPQSEILAHRCAQTGRIPGVGLCVGASIDFILGDQRRAPIWMQRLSLEWAHRLASSPRRLWRRYLIEGPKIFVAAARWRARNR